MLEGMLHIRDVEGPKKTGNMEARLEAMEQQVFKCQGMVEHGLNANHMMIMEFTNKHKIDNNDIGKHLSRLYDRIDHLQAQIYDLQNQNSDTPDPLFCRCPDLEISILTPKSVFAPTKSIAGSTASHEHASAQRMVSPLLVPHFPPSRLELKVASMDDTRPCSSIPELVG
ncbi:40S ribosomal protein S5-1 [Hordeum vulgare]|nr:40S ribosomal protein S5-1 [Hordeum vulgare]